jgi:AcrR family transcriptional regulator
VPAEKRPPVEGAPHAGRLGRVPLSERRKAETRLEIAREAVRLFAAHGVAGTSADDIAAAVGISVRTLWRYFPTKESCILPLMTTGIDATARALRASPAGRGITGLVEELERSEDDRLPDLPTLLDMVRLSRTEPGLRAVWLQAHDNAEPVFAAALAQRAGLPEDDLSTMVQAAMINVALRLAVEHHARRTDPADVSRIDLLETVRTVLRTVAAGFPD